MSSHQFCTLDLTSQEHRSPAGVPVGSSGLDSHFPLAPAVRLFPVSLGATSIVDQKHECSNCDESSSPTKELTEQAAVFRQGRGLFHPIPDTSGVVEPVKATITFSAPIWHFVEPKHISNIHLRSPILT